MQVNIHRGWVGLGVLAMLIMTACAPPPAAEPAQEEPKAQPPQLNLTRMQKAPEITNERWINTDEPLTLASQRGNVVLLEFWTFG